MITEQPLRVIAVLAVGPYLIYCGEKYEDDILRWLGILFIVIEIYCLLFIKKKCL